MGRFASPKKQAASVMKALQGDVLKSIGTVRNYEQALTQVTQYIKAEKIGRDGLHGLTPDQAITYLERRGQEVGQKTLDMERQAIQVMMQHITHKLKPAERLPVIQSEQQTSLTSRSYTQAQIKLVTEHQNERNALATKLSHQAGIRAHELLTLQKLDKNPADPRPATEHKFTGRAGETVAYSVHGKGGLTREVRLPVELSQQLEARAIEPLKITDRGVNYLQHYDIAGGKNWSNSFSAASNRALGWSRGAHGLRHSYAQERMNELQKTGLSQESALETVSQELGHFRPEITKVYLR